MLTVVETRRLTVREITVDDASHVLELLNDPGYLRYIGDRKVRSIEDAREYIRNCVIGSYDLHGFGMYLVLAKRHGEAVGMCGFVRREGLDDVDIGYALLGVHCGFGYALEAARAVLEYGRATLGLERVVAITSDDNEASMRLLRKLGFRYEQQIRLMDGEDECRLFVPGRST